MATCTHTASFSQSFGGSPIARLAEVVRSRADRTVDHAFALSLVLRSFGWCALGLSLLSVGPVSFWAWNAAWVDTWNGARFDPMALVVGAVFAAGLVLAGALATVVLVASGRALELSARRG